MFAKKKSRIALVIGFLLMILVEVFYKEIRNHISNYSWDKTESTNLKINNSNNGPDYSDSTAPENWTRVSIKTTVGDMVLALNPEQKQHSENFIKLVNSGFYNGVLFHRVIKDFMVQSGDPKSKGAAPTAQLGDGGPAGGRAQFGISGEIPHEDYFVEG